MDKLITGVYLFRQLPDGIKKANGIKVGASVPRFDGVYLFRQLPDNIKQANGIKVGASVPRLDIVGFKFSIAYKFIKAVKEMMLGRGRANG